MEANEIVREYDGVTYRISTHYADEHDIDASVVDRVRNLIQQDVKDIINPDLPL